MCEGVIGLLDRFVNSLLSGSAVADGCYYSRLVLMTTTQIELDDCLHGISPCVNII